MDDPQDGQRISAEQLGDYLARASFPATSGLQRGYHQGEVDAFVTHLVDAVRAGEPLRELVRRARFTHVRAEAGYDEQPVDDFLAAVVDLDPHATTPRPEVARSGLLTKLFG